MRVRVLIPPQWSCTTWSVILEFASEKDAKDFASSFSDALEVEVTVQDRKVELFTPDGMDVPTPVIAEFIKRLYLQKPRIVEVNYSLLGLAPISGSETMGFEAVVTDQDYATRILTIILDLPFCLGNCPWCYARPEADAYLRKMEKLCGCWVDRETVLVEVVDAFIRNGLRLIAKKLIETPEDIHYISLIIGGHGDMLLIRDLDTLRKLLLGLGAIAYTTEKLKDVFVNIAFSTSNLLATKELDPINDFPLFKAIRSLPEEYRKRIVMGITIHDYNMQKIRKIRDGVGPLYFASLVAEIEKKLGIQTYLEHIAPLNDPEYTATVLRYLHEAKSRPHILFNYMYWKPKISEDKVIKNIVETLRKANIDVTSEQVRLDACLAHVLTRINICKILNSKGRMLKLTTEPVPLGHGSFIRCNPALPIEISLNIRLEPVQNCPRGSKCLFD